MTTEHTPEPWAYSVNVGPTKGLIVEGDGSTILELFNTLRDSRFERNLRRIVACVNACAGVSTLALESGVSCVHTAQKNMELRDALAEALREAIPWMTHKLSCPQPPSNFHKHDPCKCGKSAAVTKAKAALAKL